MPFDYSRTDDPRDFSELIPHNTIVTTQMRIRPGNAGPDGLYKRTAKGDAEGLDSEFVVLDGPYAKRKFWDFFLLAGTTDGQKEMVVTNRGRLKKILESARGLSGRAQGLRQHHLHRQDRREEGRAQERRQRHELVRQELPAGRGRPRRQELAPD